MKNKLPFISNKTKICIICEGSEEYDYLKRLISLDVWDSKYAIALKNADGNGNIAAIYQNEFQNDSYDVILVFCDTDKKPYEQYEDIKRKIETFLEKEISDKIVIFTNPCVMQVILLHFADVKLKSQSKKTNSGIIEKLTGITNYKAKAEQREKIVALINNRNYLDMLERAKILSKNDKDINSTNFDIFAKYFETFQIQWIKEIDDLISN